LETFPVTNSTLSAIHLGAFLQSKYNLDSNASCRLLKTGINDSYLITNNAIKYVFRVYSLNWRSEKEIEEEIRLLNLLKENGMPVSYPITDADGSYIQEFAAPEGRRYGVMFSFAKGEKLLNIPADVHFKIGQIMAKIHRLTANLKLERAEYSPKVILIDSFDQLKKFFCLILPLIPYQNLMQKRMIFQ